MTTTEPTTLLLWTLRTWPKAQHLARALGIPSDAWEIPFMFAPLGGPELSVFEAMEKPELGGLTARLKALTKPVAAAAYADPWIKSVLLRESKLALAFHPGVNADQVRAMCTRDGYRVVDMATAIEERGDVALDDALTNEGLVDAHKTRSASWPDDEVVPRTVALPVWQSRHHSAAFFLASRISDWPTLSPDAARAVRELVATDIAHPVLTQHLTTLP